MYSTTQLYYKRDLLFKKANSLTDKYLFEEAAP